MFFEGGVSFPFFTFVAKTGNNSADAIQKVAPALHGAFAYLQDMVDELLQELRYSGQVLLYI